MSSSCVPPPPSVTLIAVVPLDSSFDTSISYALAYAASQLSLTFVISAGGPRSMVIHCGSLNDEDQRVAGVPSPALLAGYRHLCPSSIFPRPSQVKSAPMIVKRRRPTA